MGLRRLTAAIAAIAVLGPLGVSGAGATATHLRHRVAEAKAASPVAHASTTVHAGTNIYGKYTPLVGDFNGDGHDDIFWYAPGRNASSVWFGDVSGNFTVVHETIWFKYSPVVLDVNGDGRSDIVWYRQGNPDPLWLGNADGSFTERSFQGPGPALTGVAGDFNGDGHDDILWDAPGFPHDVEWLSNGHGGFTQHGVEIVGSFKITVGDFNGDGRDDLLLTAIKGGSDYIGMANSDGTFTFRVATGAPPNTVAFVLDANHDGYDDLFFYGPGATPDTIWYGGASGIPQSRVATEINGTSYMPFSGDFNGDGHDDVFWYAPGAAPDAFWSDAERHIPTPRSSDPQLRWENNVPARDVVGLALDQAQAFVETTDGKLTAYDRTTGLADWSVALACRGQLVRQSNVALVHCDNVAGRTFVYNLGDGSVLAQYTVNNACFSDDQNDMVVWAVPPGGSTAHLTVMDARTGAVLWRTPVAATAATTPCALSGDRLMVARDGSPGGVEEFSLTTKQLVFNRADHTTVWRFSFGGYVALCDTNDNLVGLNPSGTIAWKTDVACPSSDSPFSFGASTTDLESGVDVDIVSGTVLGSVSSPPIAASGVGGNSTADGALFVVGAHTPNPADCPGRGSEVMFLGPHGASSWLAGATAVRGVDFSHRAILVELASAGCPPFQVAAWSESGFIRWVMPDSVAFNVNGPIADDLLTSGGDESRAILGSNTTDGNLELVSLP
ncbi:MAG TPA: FG-GAP-like repeat-containing protein [Acidimicrobiia bacterium]